MSSNQPNPSRGSAKVPDALAKSAEAIPSFYYDIIARIIPGAATIAGVAWVFGKDVIRNDTYNWIVLTGAGYIVGLLLSVGSTILVNVIAAAPTWRHRYSDSSIWRGVWRRRNDPDASVVVKMAAEATSAENLLIGAIVVLGAAFLRPRMLLAGVNVRPEETATHRVVLVLVCLVLFGLVAMRRYFLRVRIDAPEAEAKFPRHVEMVRDVLLDSSVITAVCEGIVARGNYVDDGDPDNVAEAIRDLLRRSADTPMIA